MKEALDIQVKGIVQGVGFRPFVYRLAKKYLIDGWVLNATDGVFIHAEGETKLLDEFVIELSENPPAASRVDELSLKEVPLEGFDTFEIRFSDAGAVEKTTLVSPDLATCDDCARELFNPNDRRYRYPFINCTNCGPRFTIIEKLPYDRKSTSMKDFPMCERCAREYGDPLDRRFHAQPDACFECGPHISWREHEGMPGALAGVHAPGVSADVPAAPDVPAGASASHAAQTNVSRETLCASDAIDAPLGPIAWGTTREESDAILARAVELLLAGKILAVKGLGGFHLVCDASNPEAVALLRARKRREGKAFAVMMADMEAVRAYCEAGEAEEGILTATQRPIVLLRKRPDAVFAPGLADALPELGVMLPYTPLQHLLLHDFAKASGCAERSSQREAEGSRAATAVPMLVMTSGNIHDEPSSSTTRMPTRSCSPWPTRSWATTAPSAPATTTRWCALSKRAAPAKPSNSSAAPEATRRSRWRCPRRRAKEKMFHVKHPFANRVAPSSPPGPSRRTRLRSRATPRRSCRSTSATSRTPKPTTRGSRRRTATKRCSRSNPTASRATCIPSTSRRSGPTSRASPSPRCSTIMRTSCR